MKRWSRTRSLSRSPLRGASASGLLGARLRWARARPISGPGMYMAPVDISTLMSMRPIAGRTDWKYPRHSTIPPPMSLVSLSVKNDRTLKGYLRFGPMRTTTLSAYPEPCQRRYDHNRKINCSYRDRGQDRVVSTLLASQETLKDSRRQLRIN